MSSETTRNLNEIEICRLCGKRKGKASLTAWMFAHNSCQCQFNRPVGRQDLAGDASNSHRGQTDAPEVNMVRPTICARYRLIELIGQGGMGSVYRAHDELLDRTVAVKMLRNELVTDPAVKRRFEKEVKAAARLDHHNLVSVLNCGVTELGDPFLVMDFVEGRSLASVLAAETTLASGRAINIFLQVLGALSYAHAKGVIHRDVKPSNIILTDCDGNSDFVKLVDFGIAKSLREQDLESQNLTQTGEVFGSPLYMSPEQCLGQKLDVRSDIYSVGCVMYECLTGVPPFAGINPIQTIFQRLNEEPKPFKSVSTSRRTPCGLEDIVLRALEKDKENRYQTAIELACDLRAVQAGRHLPRYRRNKRKTKLSPLLSSVIASLALFSTLLSFAGAFLVSSSFFRNESASICSFDSRWQQLQLEGNRAFDCGDYAKALSSFNNAFALSCQTNRIDNAISSLNDAADVERASGHQLESDAALARAADLQQKQLRHTSALFNELNEMMEQLALQKGRGPEVKESERLASRVNDMAAGLIESGHHEKARGLLSKLDRLFDVRNARSSLVKRRTLHNLGYANHCLGNYAETVPLYEKCLSLGKPNTEDEERLEALTLLLLGRAYIQTGLPLRRCQPILEKSLAIFRRDCGPYSQEVAWVRYHLAGMYLSQGSLAAAEEEVRTALTIYEGTPNVDILRKASCYLLLGKMTHDLDDLNTALVLNETMIQKSYSSFVEALTETACGYQSIDPSRSRNLFLRALSVSSRLGSHDQSRCKALIYYSLGELSRSQGEYERAEGYFEQALTHRRQQHGDKSWAAYDALLSLAELSLDTRREAKADHYFTQALSIASSCPDSEHDSNRERIVQLWSRYSKLLLQRGRAGEALAMKKALRV